MTRTHRKSLRTMWTLTFSAVLSVGIIAATCLGVADAAVAHRSGPRFHGAPVHFDMTNSYTGTYASFGAAAWAGAQAAAYAINKAGGINGHQLVLDKTDDYGDPVDAVPAQKKEIATNHPSVLIGESTLTVFALEPITDHAGIPNFTAAGSLNFDHNRNPLLWRITPSDSQLAAAMAVEGHNRGCKTGAILFQAGTPDNQLAPDLKRVFSRLGGKILTLQFFALNQTSYLSEVEKSLTGHPQCIFVDIPATNAATIMNNYREVNGLNDQFIGTTLTAAVTFTKAVGATVVHKHLVSLQPGSTGSGPAVKTFLHDYAVANGVSYKTAIVGAQAGANYVYDAVNIAALAMDYAGTSNPKVWNKDVTKVSNAPGQIVYTYPKGLQLLKRHKKINYTGAAGPDTYNQYHNEFGSWSATQVSATGKSVKTLNAISAAELKKVSS